ncbi:nitrous oxide reductase accessory protein NosL [Flagellimonas sp. HMM57]|uniref:nitrous oxide reductase accessory protein NosL n=1 Tax=unclassified Flagellimonas TaxID=2644544 RepID=UPI0013D23C8C|nr:MULTISPECIES: nitrous oxide reductase accessory protein NosL [unclassified Flagellimonas]UII76295.1 nitrous oxide reductase accessory protein NosL [Flagellimonas sp. HMM57]
MKKILFLSLILGISCSIGPKPIAYGEAGCHYCKMTIVDKQHAAQMVTKKGKVFNFDATECMLNHLKDIDQETIQIGLANDYNVPGKLIDVTEATFLISEGIPSPMGEYLTAFATKDAAQEGLDEHGGEIFTWEQLKEKFR